MKNVAIFGFVALLALTLSVGTATAGKGKQVWLGVVPHDVDYELIDDYDLDVKYGVFVEHVFDDSPADEAGLEPEDVIILLDGNKITDSEDLYDILDEHQDGDRVVVTYLREGKQEEVSAELERARRKHVFYRGNHYPGKYRHWDFDHDFDFDFDFDEDFDFDFDFDWDEGPTHIYRSRDQGYIGVTLADLTEQLGEHFGVERGRGALVVEVEEDSPAEKAGLEAGDVITAVDGRRARDAEDVCDDVRDYEEGDTVELTVTRDGQEQTVTVEVEEGYQGRGWNDFYYLQVPDLPAVPSIPALPDLPAIPEIPDLPDRSDLRLLRSLGWSDLSSDVTHHYRLLGLEQEDVAEELEDLQDELRDLRQELKDELREARSGMK